MAVYINDTVNKDADCETPIPKVCGRQTVHMPTASCDTIHFTGVDDAEINQGQDFDPTEGVHAYDGNGEEIPFTVEPSEVDECQVGEIELEYTATGVGKKMLPKLCGSPNLKLPYCGVGRKRLKRNLVIKGIAPPSIRGIERVCLDRETLFNPMDGVSAVDGNGNTLEVSHSGIYDGVASGEIASFESIGGKSRSLKISLEPIQDLHGYDKPWAAGAGKNLIDSDILINDTYNKYNIPNPLKNGQTYTYSVYGDNSFAYGLFAGHTNTAVPRPNIPVAEQRYVRAGNYQTFTAPDDIEDWEYLFLGGSGNGAGSKEIRVQVEEGTVANPTYHPYSNICPISGHTECVTQRTGVNVWDEEWESGAIDGASGGAYTDSTRIRSKSYVSVLPNTVYYVKMPYAFNYAWYDAEKRYIGGDNSASPNYARISPNNARYLKFSTAGTTYNNDISINYPRTDTDYHEGHVQTYTTSLGQIVYGGTLDVVSGELVVDRAMVDLGSLNWGYDTRWGYMPTFYTSFTEGKEYPSNVVADMQCSQYATVSANDLYRGKEGSIANNGLYTRVTDTRYTDVTAFKTAMDGVQLCYELATPQTYQLTPQEVELLTGTNNVWSDGEVTVAYPANIPDGIYNYPFDGVYEITYHAEDKCGNETTEVRQVIVSKSNSVCGARVCCATVAC